MSGLTSYPFLVTAEPVPVMRQDLELAVSDASAVQVGRRRWYADGNLCNRGGLRPSD